MTKKKRIGFTVTDSVYEAWKNVSEDLIERNVFRSKTEMFETLVYFLQRARREEILAFKQTTIIV